MMRRLMVALLVATTGCTLNLADGGGGEPGVDDDCSLDADSFNPCAANAFQALARRTDGEYFEASSASWVPSRILDAIEAGTRSGGGFDLVFIIDKTGSMADDIGQVQSAIGSILSEIEARGDGTERVAVIAYGDQCNDTTWYTELDLTSDFTAVRNEVNGITATGGGDIPESVFEAVERTMYGLDWRAENRFGILIGDAGPHPVGDSCRSTTLDEAVDAARSAGVTVNLYPILVAL